MKVINTYIITYIGEYAVLYECEDEKFYVHSIKETAFSSPGIFSISKERAKELIKNFEG